MRVGTVLHEDHDCAHHNIIIALYTLIYKDRKVSSSKE